MSGKMMPRGLAAAAFILATLGGRPDACGGMITATQTGVGTGSIGGAPFTAEPFVITSIADTDNKTTFSLYGNYGFNLPNNSASISISGVGTYQFLTQTQLFVNQTTAGVGFGELPGGYDLYDGPQNAAFSTWAMERR